MRDEILTGYSVQAFLADPANHGWKAETRRRYGLCLGELADYLEQNAPPGAEPDRPILEAWRQQVESRFTGSTVNAYLAAANNYFRWCGRPDLTLRRERPAAEEERPFPAVTRVEYLKLLRAARTLGRRRAYLLVKLFANTDLPLYCLDQLTVERIRQGRAELDYRGSPVDFRCPPSLQAELLAYAAAAGVYRGPLFVTRRGQLLNSDELEDIFAQLGSILNSANCSDVTAEDELSEYVEPVEGAQPEITITRSVQQIGRDGQPDTDAGAPVMIDLLVPKTVDAWNAIDENDPRFLYKHLLNPMVPDIDPATGVQLDTTHNIYEEVTAELTKGDAQNVVTGYVISFDAYDPATKTTKTYTYTATSFLLAQAQMIPYATNVTLAPICEAPYEVSQWSTADAYTALTLRGSEGQAGTEAYGNHAILYMDHTAYDSLTVNIDGVRMVTPPTEDELIGNIGDIFADDVAVIVDCVNAEEDHADKTSGLTADTFEISELLGNSADGYNKASAGHVLAPEETYGVVHLDYDKNNGWYVKDESQLPVVFEVVCAPDLDDINNATGNAALTLDCVNGDQAAAGHNAMTMALQADTYTVSPVDGAAETGYTVTVTVQPHQNYLDAYNAQYKDYAHSYVANDANDAVITLVNKDGVWTAKDNDTAFFAVSCPAKTTVTPSNPPVDEHPDIAEGIANGTWGGKPTPTPAPAASGTAVIPQTADAADIGLWTLLAVLSLAGLTGLGLLRRKRGQ